MRIVLPLLIPRYEEDRFSGSRILILYFRVIVFDMYGCSTTQGTHKKCKNHVITFILPDLICDKAPTSITGVFPVAFLSSIGPVFGRRRPNLSVLPKVKLATSRRNLSTSLKGNHLRSFMATENVEIPNISLGKI